MLYAEFSLHYIDYLSQTADAMMNMQISVFRLRQLNKRTKDDIYVMWIIKGNAFGNINYADL